MNRNGSESIGQCWTTNNVRSAGGGGGGLRGAIGGGEERVSDERDARWEAGVRSNRDAVVVWLRRQVETLQQGMDHRPQDNTPVSRKHTSGTVKGQRSLLAQAEHFNSLAGFKRFVDF